ncbi:MAG: hypothetical protein CMJ83_20040, partial [Planctomycetes bacterium]|nr:hypothetical protein [Planctomycetota bacterium]
MKTRTGPWSAVSRVVIGAILVAALGACSDDEASDPVGDGLPADSVDRIVEHFNRGVALMDRYQPVKAVEAFQEVVRLAPGWTLGRLNLGIALLNSQSDEGYVRAEVELGRVIEAAPDEPYAHFALGMLLRHLTRFGEARGRFERVLEIDPEDADAHFQLGILLVDEDRVAARRHLETTLEKIPHHESACYRLHTLLRQAGETEQATDMLARFKSLKASKAGVIAGMKYGEMGRYADVIRVFDPGAAGLPQPASRLPAFEDTASSLGLSLSPSDAPGSSAFGPSVAVADIDGDGDLDVYLAGGGADGPGTFFLNDGKRFVAATAAGVDGRNAIGAWFGDYDKDGDPDLYLTCAGPNRLYRNEGQARFVDVTEATGVAGGSFLSVGAVWADLDHDGDLDL